MSDILSIQTNHENPYFFAGSLKKEIYDKKCNIYAGFFLDKDYVINDMITGVYENKYMISITCSDLVYD